MPANPIQRRTRNALLLGMLIMLMIAIVIVGVLYFMFFKDIIQEAQSKEKVEVAYAYRLTADVKSGETIGANKVEIVKEYIDELPADCLTTAEKVSLYKSKVALKAGTIISKSLVYQNEMVKKSERLVEYNMLTFPSTLSVGDFVDIRLTLPNGQDYIVVSKKEVVSLKDTTVGFHLTEDEILMMSSAIIESYIIKASNLHVVQYVEAGLQKKATSTYAVNSKVYALVLADYQNKSKTDEDGNTLNNIENYEHINLTTEKSELRRSIEEALGVYEDEKKENLEQKVEEQKNTSMELYLSGLEGY